MPGPNRTTGYANYNDHEIKRATSTKEWARGKLDRIEDIKANGEIGTWTAIKNLPGDAMREMAVDWHEMRHPNHGGSDTTRDQAFAAAKEEALKSYQTGQKTDASSPWIKMLHGG